MKIESSSEVTQIYWERVASVFIWDNKKDLSVTGVVVIQLCQCARICCISHYEFVNCVMQMISVIKLF